VESAETHTATAEDEDPSAKLKADIDAILDDIEEVLESDAQAFIDGFRQRGGE
jgi:ubiquitin-like protein Pup